MKRLPKIRIEVTLPPAVVLEQLARYGKDWHESRLPAEVRGSKLWLNVQGSSFKLQWPRTNTVWCGSVVDAEDRGGSLVTAAAEPQGGVLIGPLLGFALGVGLAVVRGAGLAFVVTGLCLSALLLVLISRAQVWSAERQAPLCRAILLRATQATPGPPKET